MIGFQRLRGLASPSLLANMRLSGQRSWPSRSVSTLGTARAKKADGWRKSLALVQLSLPRWWPRSEMEDVLVRPQSCCMDRLGAETAFDRRQRETGQHLETGQSTF